MSTPGLMSTSSKRKRLSGSTDSAVGHPLGWEDVQGLIDGDQRPIIWTRSNTILSAHPDRPAIIGRIPGGPTPASSQTKPVKFTLQSADPIALAPNSYAPATFMCLSPNDNHLFAYFPSNRSADTTGLEGASTGNSMSRSEDGIACFWDRGLEVDTWNVVGWLGMAPSDRVIDGRWLGGDREWLATPSSSSTGFNVSRAVPAGPQMLPNTAAILLVLESNSIQLCWRAPSPRLVINSLRAPLSQPYEIIDGNKLPISKINSRSMRVLRASIGLVPGESSVLIATSCCLMPPPPPLQSLSIALLDPTFDDSAQPLPPKERSLDLVGIQEMLSEVVELNELRIILTNLTSSNPALPKGPSIICSPLAPIFHDVPSSASLTHLSFISCASDKGKMEDERMEDSVFTPPDGSNDPAMAKITQKDGLALLLTYLDSQRGTIPPYSTLHLYRMVRASPHLCDAFVEISESADRVAATAKEMAEWTPTSGGTRTFSEHVVNLIADPAAVRDGHVLIGLTSNSIERERHKGKRSELRLLSSNTLGDDLDTRPTLLYHKRDVPLSAAFSPNRLFLCMTTPLRAAPLHLIASYPSKAYSSPDPSLRSDHLASSLTLALLNSSDPSDVARSLWSTGATRESVQASLTLAWEMLDALRDPDDTNDAEGNVSADPATETAQESPQKMPGSTPGKSPENMYGGMDARLVDCSPWFFRFVECLSVVYRSSPDPETAQAWKTCYDISRLAACERLMRVSHNLELKIKTYPAEIRANPVFWDGFIEHIWSLVAYTSWYLDLCKRLVADAVLEHAWELWEEQEEGSIRGDRVLSHFQPSTIILLHPVPLSLLVLSLKYTQHFLDWIAKRYDGTHAYLIRCATQDVVDRSFLDLDTLQKVFSAAQSLCKTHCLNAPSSSVWAAFREALITMSIPAPLGSLSRDISQILATRGDLANRIALVLPDADLLQAMPMKPASRPKDVVSLTALRPGQHSRTCLRCGEKNGPIKVRGPLYVFFEDLYNRRCVCGGSWAIAA